MQHYLFASPAQLNNETLISIEAMDDVCEDFFSIALNNDKELEILLNLLGIDDFQSEQLPQESDFGSFIDISSFRLPEYNLEEFNSFYDQWLLKSGRESDMDEYGQLTFLQGHAQNWNKRQYRVVLSEKL